MPAPTDNLITDWADDYLTQDSNKPENDYMIGGFLDDEVRNMKSVVRAESTNKEWVKTGWTPTYVSATSFTVTGDQRVEASPGRRLKATQSGGAVFYGKVSSSSYSYPNTTITVAWDTETLTQAPSSITANQFKITGDYTSRIGVANECVRVWVYTSAASPSQASMVRDRHVVNTSYATGNTTVNLTTGNPEEVPLNGEETKVQIPSTGINATVNTIEIGGLSPDSYQAGWPHSLIAGAFQVTFANSAGPYTVDFPDDDGGNPIAMDTTSYQVAITPTLVVSGTPSVDVWRHPMVSAKNVSNFTVTYPAAIDAGTIEYGFVLVRS